MSEYETNNQALPESSRVSHDLQDNLGYIALHNNENDIDNPCIIPSVD